MDSSATVQSSQASDATAGERLEITLACCGDGPCTCARRSAEPVDIHPITKNALKEPDRICHHCHYPLFEARTPAVKPENGDGR